MTNRQNPFLDLYVTESISSDTFVKVFSTALLAEADVLALFQPGNVLLIGLQGSGKTALLNLLKPEIFIAYRRANQKWPLPNHCSRFISAGINLSKSSAMDFGQRPLEADSSGEGIKYALYFADFLNFWVVDDLFQSLETLYKAQVDGVRDFLGINASEDKLDALAFALAKKSCWLGSLINVTDYKSLREALNDRVVMYRNFLNYNTDTIPDFIQRSKTGAGEPISSTVDALREAGIIPHDLPVFIRIDQFEDLMGIESKANLGFEFRAVVYKMLGMRDSRLSYRIGARPYSVPKDFRMLGTNSVIEELRNYKVVDIDATLRRKEHSSGLFPRFAEDVFEKRLIQVGYQIPSNKKSLISQVFGARPTAEERAKNYTKDSTDGIVNPDSSWPKNTTKFLFDLCKKDPVSAKLGEAWLRQQALRSKNKIPEITESLWNSMQRRWWKKERLEQAVLQIAAARRQRMIWSGDKDILSLSGGNILVFLNICQLIWAEHLRTAFEQGNAMPLIHNPITQDLGIQQASEYWYRKLRADPNGGDDRHRFISVLGGELRQGMRDDLRMSYPGGNGFSLSDRELELSQDIGSFLDLCVAYGALTVGRHTPKTSSRGESKKWYLFPILSPYFQLPTAHTKEPIYATTQFVKKWLNKAQVFPWQENEPLEPKKVLPQKISSNQMSLFSIMENKNK